MGFKFGFFNLIGGILLPGSMGILDPCEKEPCDAFSNLTSQQREDITVAAQNILRLIAFRQVTLFHNLGDTACLIILVY